MQKGLFILTFILCLLIAGCSGPIVTARTIGEIENHPRLSKSFVVNENYRSLGRKLKAGIESRTTDFEVRLSVHNDLGISEILAGNHAARAYLLYIKITEISPQESKIEAFLRTLNVQYERTFHELEEIARSTQ